MNLFTLFKRHFKGILLVLSLLLIENVAWVVEPALFGKLIDAFIAKADKENFQTQMSNL